MKTKREIEARIRSIRTAISRMTPTSDLRYEFEAKIDALKWAMGKSS